MSEETNTVGPPETSVSDQAEAPVVVDRSSFQAGLDALRVREKAHTREGDAIAAARRQLPMVEVDATIALIGPHGAGHAAGHVRRPPAADRLLPHVVRRPACRGAVRRLHALQRAGARAVLPAFARRHLRHVLPGPVRGERALPRLHGLGRAVVLGAGLRRGAARRASGGMFYLVCYLRQGDRVFETYWTDGRGVEPMGNELRPAGPDRLRATGAVGGLARRLAAAVGAQYGGTQSLPHKRTPDRTVVTPGGWTL